MQGPACICPCSKIAIPSPAHSPHHWLDGVTVMEHIVAPVVKVWGGEGERNSLREERGGRFPQACESAQSMQAHASRQGALEVHKPAPEQHARAHHGKHHQRADGHQLSKHLRVQIGELGAGYRACEGGGRRALAAPFILASFPALQLPQLALA